MIYNRMSEEFVAGWAGSSWFADDWKPDPEHLASRAVEYYTKALRGTCSLDLVESNDTSQSQNSTDQDAAILQELLQEAVDVSSYQRMRQHFLIDSFRSSSV